MKDVKACQQFCPSTMINRLSGRWILCHKTILLPRFQVTGRNLVENLMRQISKLRIENSLAQVLSEGISKLWHGWVMGLCYQYVSTATSSNDLIKPIGHHSTHIMTDERSFLVCKDVESINSNVCDLKQQMKGVGWLQKGIKCDQFT